MLYAKNSYKYTQIILGLDQYEAQTNVPIAHVYYQEDIYSLLKDFKNISIEQTHIFPYNIEEYKKYNYIIDEPFASMTDDEFKLMEKELGWHLCIKCFK